MEDDNHDADDEDNVYRLTWSLVRVLTVVLWVGFMVVIQVSHRLYDDDDDDDSDA